jgi:hypothetical protein
MNISSDFKTTGKIKLDQILLLASDDKNGKGKNSHKMQKMMKKIGTQSKINEIQKMLEQIREERKRDKKPIKNPTKDYLQLETTESEDLNVKSTVFSRSQRFSLKNIKNITFQTEHIDQTLDKTETHEFQQKKSFVSQTLGHARNFIKNQDPYFFDVPRNYLKPQNPGYIYQNTEPEEDPTNPFKGLKCNENPTNLL